MTDKSEHPIEHSFGDLPTQTHVGPPQGATTPETRSAPGPSRVSVPGYEILAELGRGGMGIVYKARQIKADRVVALKMILSGQRADTIELTRFQTEAEALARVAHPGVVQVYEIGEHEGMPFFSQELCPGGNLAEHLDQFQLVPRNAPSGSEAAGRLVKLVELMSALADAVDTAHRVGVVHRDLKPSNVLLTADGRPKISDFGLAKRLDVAERQTYTGMVLGTPAYMAPEQAAGETRYVGPAVDIYALGIILFELLTGRLPFQAADKMRLLEEARTGEPPSPRRLQPRVPRDLDTICLKCLQKEPGQRYATAADLVDDLRRFRDGEPIAARPATPLERIVKWARRRPTIAGLYGLTALVLLLGGLGIGAAWLWQRAEGLRTVAEQAGATAADAQNRAEGLNEELSAAKEQIERLHYLHRIRLAHREALAKEYYRAETLLASCPEPLRDWEWYFVQKMCQGGERVFRSHAAGTQAVIFSPDARFLLVVAPDGMKLWNRATNQLMQFWTSVGGAFNVAAYSPDGRAIATGAFAVKLRQPETLVQIWDPDTGKELARLKDRAGLMYSLAFSPDGRRLAGGCVDGTITLWDTRTWQVERTLTTPSEVNGLDFSRDGSLLASVGHRDHIQVWGPATGELRQTLTRAGPPQIRVAFSADGRQLASTDTDGTVWLWDRAAGTAAEVSRNREPGANPVSFHPNGKALVFGRDRHAVVRDLATGQDRLLEGHSGRVTHAAVSADGTWLASGSADGYVRLYSLDATTEAREPWVRKIQPQSAPMVRLAPGEDQFALVHPGRMFGFTRVKVCDGAGAVRAEWAVDVPSVQDPAVSPDFRWFANVQGKTSVQVRALATGRLERTLVQDGGAHELVYLTFTPDGRWLAGCSETRATFWNFDTGKIERVLDHVPTRPWGLVTTGTSLYFSPDSRWCAYATDEGAVVRDWAEDRVVTTCPRHLGEIVTMAFNRDGSRWATASADGVIKVWDLSTGREEHTLVGHTALITSVTFHPGGRRLASGAGDGSLRLWDLTSGEEALMIEEPGGLFAPVFFTPSGRGLVWGTQKGLWLASVADPKSEPGALATGQSQPRR